MRHRKKGKTLDRKVGPRQLLLRNMAASLVLYEKIKTTRAKAQAVRPLVERLVTLGKTNTLYNRRLLQKQLFTENAIKKILEVLGPRYKERKGGYTRMINIKQRQGDGAPVVQVEFV